MNISPITLNISTLLSPLLLLLLLQSTSIQTKLHQPYHQSYQTNYQSSCQLHVYSPKVCTPDYYLFSLLKSNDTFLIHGLWVEECNECPTCGYPTFCNVVNSNCTFNITSLKSLINQLDKLWYPGNNINKIDQLLTHEWCKHGLCTNFTEFQYFNKSLSIYDRIVNQGYLDSCDYNQEECGFKLDINFRIEQ
jgi:hypothetical protein